MIKRIWAWITGGELVWLRDHDKTVTLSIAYTDPWGDKIAKRYWPNSIRTVVLRPDGTVDGTYVVEWKPYKTT